MMMCGLWKRIGRSEGRIIGKRRWRAMGRRKQSDYQAAEQGIVAQKTNLELRDFQTAQDTLPRGAKGHEELQVEHRNEHTHIVNGKLRMRTSYEIDIGRRQKSGPDSLQHVVNRRRCPTNRGLDETRQKIGHNIVKVADEDPTRAKEKTTKCLKEDEKPTTQTKTN